MKKAFPIILVFFGSMGILPSSSLQADYDLTWHTIDGGGGYQQQQ